jgi:hypothetical protein
LKRGKGKGSQPHEGTKKLWPFGKAKTELANLRLRHLLFISYNNKNSTKFCLPVTPDKLSYRTLLFISIFGTLDRTPFKWQILRYENPADISVFSRNPGA